MAVFALVLFGLWQKAVWENVHEEAVLTEQEKIKLEIEKLKQDVTKIKISKAESNAKKQAAKAKSNPQVQYAVVYPVDCNKYRTEVAKYNWNVNVALFVFSKESGCIHQRPASPTNDYGLCQLHNEYIAEVNPHIKRCYEKYKDARKGSYNWSAWYAVCSRPYWKDGVWYDYPQPLYAGIKCI